MPSDIDHDIRERMELKSTEELCHILEEDDREQYRSETFEVIRAILTERNSRVPSPAARLASAVPPPLFCASCSSDVGTHDRGGSCPRCGRPLGWRFSVFVPHQKSTGLIENLVEFHSGGSFFRKLDMGKLILTPSLFSLKHQGLYDDRTIAEMPIGEVKEVEFRQPEKPGSGVASSLLYGVVFGSLLALGFSDWTERFFGFVGGTLVCAAFIHTLFYDEQKRVTNKAVYTVRRSNPAPILFAASAADSDSILAILKHVALQVAHTSHRK